LRWATTVRADVGAKGQAVRPRGAEAAPTVRPGVHATWPVVGVRSGGATGIATPARPGRPTTGVDGATTMGGRGEMTMGERGATATGP
jgi:hypothetical protein